MELALSGTGTLTEQIYQALRARIESASLPGGSRLPGSRTLARALGVSRGTVAAAYERLEAEGYCECRARSGLRVTELLPVAAPAVEPAPPPRRPAQAIRWPTAGSAPALDLRPGLPNAADFPRTVWNGLVRRALQENWAERFAYPEPEGLPRLRTAIAAHLRRRRGLRAEPERILITGGAQQAFALIVQALLPAGARVAVEDPGYRGFSEAARLAGGEVLPVPVDQDGLVVDALPARVQAVYVTPAHQFPTGTVLSAARRRALLRWAGEHGAWIIEDDYDSEYRFAGPPLPPLAELDPAGRVLLVGSFSKTVFPGLRLGYLAAGDAPLERLARARNLADAGISTLEQDALARFIEDGHYERHLRRSQRRHAVRRRALIEALERHFPGRVRVSGAEAGLHLIAHLGLGVAEERAVLRRCRAHGVSFHTQERFGYGGPARSGLVLGFARLEPDALAAAVAVLAAAVAAVRPSPAARRR